MNRIVHSGLSVLLAFGLVGAASAQTTQSEAPAGGKTETPTGAQTGTLPGGQTGAQPTGAAGAQTPTTPQASESVSKLDSADRQFLNDAAQSGALEIEGSKLALEKSQNAQVKEFAQKMIDDHTKVSQKLAELAKSKGYEPPNEPSLMQKAKLKALSMRDEGFDEAYANEIGVDAHEDAVKLFEKSAQDVKDPEVKQFATETLPSLKMHLEAAQALQKSVVPAKKQ
ncbi:DUF4142 domain-containing protein [Bordetella sp. 02P26C-1]|uniref:DUF4142 domain-containing protein n=1 Tax=Bordetella sp. 02P26C-1 TaxID=2683195 RepID=UPI001354B1E8|nr:DUF4142 domain-containing protein [Bordetella sp. 02P26C-1]MVW79902.1 DUF4142 domain-containing protein [Bordetella sp. 02P26C-1]